MRRVPLMLVAGGASATLLLAPASALPDSSGDEGLDLLRRAAIAAETLAYRGTQLVSLWSPSGATSAVVEVSHDPGEGSLVRLNATPANDGRLVLREDAARAARTGFDPGTIARIARNYDTRVAGTERVAGRPAYVVAVRAQGGPVVARFWIDRRTHLALRREFVDADGRIVRESAFITIEFAPVALGVHPSAEALPALESRPVTPRTLVLLARDGWHVPQLDDRMELFDARVVERGDEPVLHLSYSDGVSAVSLFQQRGRLDSDGLDGWRRTSVGDSEVWVEEAFPRRVTWSSRGTVYTVVAECPQHVLDGFVRSLPHGEPRRGMLSRLGRGFARVASWLNPFG